MSTAENEVVKGIRSEYKYGFSNPDEAKNYFFKSGRGISHEVVEAIAVAARADGPLRLVRQRQRIQRVGYPLSDDRRGWRCFLLASAVRQLRERDGGVALVGLVAAAGNNSERAGHDVGLIAGFEGFAHALLIS